MNSEIKVSVCVVTYNHENYIADCLQSIVSQQTDFDFEIIICDDCSTDKTREIINSFKSDFPSLIKVYFHSENIGAFKNWVFAHNQAKGTYISHMDGDDKALPNKLQKQADFLDNNTTFNATWHLVDFFNDRGDWMSGLNSSSLDVFDNGVVDFDNALAIGSIATNSSIMYRKSARFTHSPDFEVLDLFYTWEYLSTGLGKILPDVLGAYRINSSSSVSTHNSLKVKKLYAEHANYYLEKFPEKKKYIFSFVCVNLLSDIKNQRHQSAYDFFKLTLKTISFPSLFLFPLFLMKSFSFKSPKIDVNND